MQGRGGTGMLGTIPLKNKTPKNRVRETRCDQNTEILILHIVCGVSFNLYFISHRIGFFSTELGKRDKRNYIINGDLRLQK